MCGEYGTERHRPHYHFIMFNLPKKLMNPDELTHCWTTKNPEAGFVHYGEANVKTMSYTAGYIMKRAFKPLDIIDTDTGEIITDDRQPEFSLMSKGMGLNFQTPQMEAHLKAHLRTTLPLNGFTYSLPRYIKDRIFTKAEKLEIQQQAEKDQEHYFQTVLKGDYRQQDQIIQDKIRKYHKEMKQYELHNRNKF